MLSLTLQDKKNKLFQGDQPRHLLDPAFAFSSEAFVSHAESKLLNDEQALTFWDRLAMLWLRVAYKIKAWWRSSRFVRG